MHRSISTGCIGSVPSCSASSSPTAISPIASPSPSHSDFREPDQLGPHASSMSAKVSNSSCGRMRFNRSIAASMGSDCSGAGSSSTPVTTVPSAFNDHSASRTPYGRLCTLKLELTAVLERMQRQLHLARTLLGQDDRLIEEDIFHPRRRTNRGQGHRRIRRPGNDNGAVDDVIGQPRLRLDGQPAGVDGVAGGEILCTTQDSGYGRTVDGDAGRLGPEATALERIGGQFESATGLTMQRSEIGSVAADVGRGQRVGDLAPVTECPYAARRSPAARPSAPARPAPQPRSAPVADRSPSTPSIPAPPRCAHFRRIAPAGGNAAASIERRAGFGP